MDKRVMKRAVPIIVFIIISIFGAKAAVAVEEAQYEVLKKENRFEIRYYEPRLKKNITKPDTNQKN